ncbi:MAG: serine/threonine-protein kinase [Deltaproteobacteria bacterium]
MRPRNDSASQLPTADRRIGDLDRFGPYTIVERLASGGMAEIYKVRHDQRPDVTLALKCIRSDCDDDIEFRRMLMDEAKIASHLDHPNINRVVEVVQHGDTLGLILELVDGLDLGRMKRHLKDKEMQLPLEVVIHVIREVLEGLDAAHSARDENGEFLHVVHRDVSPGNVMVDVSGHVRLVDFGIARAQNRLAKTEAGNVKGKFRYMAPEQIRGDGVGVRSDIYSTAVLLWELLSGVRIFDDSGVAQLMLRVANAHVPSLDEARPGMPKSLFKVFKKATALAPEDRYASARAFAEALDSVLLEYDALKCKRYLAHLVRECSEKDSRAGFSRAVARARYAAESDLEDAILSALETPDRVERVDPQDSVQAEPAHSTDVRLTTDLSNEPPTMPMARPVRADSEAPADASL